MITRCVLLCCMLSCLAFPLFGQNEGFYVPPDTVTDSELEYVPTEKAHLFAGRPGKAALFSLILPGAGQAYNKKYWQVPIVWAAVGGMGYVVAYNSGIYRDYDEAYDIRLANGGPSPDEEYPYVVMSTQQIYNERVRWNKNRQLAIIGFAAVWIANSAQAFVSAHLMEFDIDDDLSLQLLPEQEINFSDPFSTPLSVTLQYRF